MLHIIVGPQLCLLNDCAVFLTFIPCPQFGSIRENQTSRIEISMMEAALKSFRSCRKWVWMRVWFKGRVHKEEVSQHIIVRLTFSSNKSCKGFENLKINRNLIAHEI